MRYRKNPAELRFTPYKKGRLQKELHGISDKRTYLRLKAVLSVAQGMEINAVATMVEKSVQIVYSWIRCFVRSHDQASLFGALKKGCPTAEPGITAKHILRELRRDPLRLGYNTTV